MSKADGSVVINTKLNTNGFGDGAKNLRSQFSDLSASAKKLGGVIAAAFSVKAIAGFGNEIIKSYADYEQLIGGIETLYGNATAKVAAAAENAFYTVNMSANEYMDTITSFSASLISSLGGDTEKAAEVADMALQDMSDNANKMGSSLESIKTAYQGFAKQQYMLLDNLKLGYGGTKTEMERLLKDAEKLTGQRYDINNLSDVYNAIHAIQVELGVAGATAAEAEKTITGSANMTKAAWQNVLKALGGGGDLDVAINNLVFSVSKLFQNIMPVVDRALSGIGQMIEQAAPAFVETVAAALIKAIPSLLEAIFRMIIGLASGIFKGIVSLFSGTTKEIEKQLTSTNGIAENNNKAADSAEKLADETERAGKEAKKALAGFDELNILTSAKETEETELGISGGTGALSSGASSSGGQSNWDVATKKVAETNDAIVALMSSALLVLGVVLTFTGANIPLGLGMIAVGAVGLGKVITENWDTISQALKGPFGAVVALVSTALLAVGAALAFSGANIGLGIGLMAVGAVGLGTTIAVNWDSITQVLVPVLDEIAMILGAALLVIGAIIAFSGGGLPLGIGLMIAGVAGLSAGIAVNWNAITEAIVPVLDEISMIVGGALLVLGAIFAFTGAGLPLGIGLMLAGAAGLAVGIVANWDSLKKPILDVLSSILAIISGAMLVIGVLLCFTGAGVGLGLTLILGSIAGTVAATSVSDNPVTRFVKGMVNSILGLINMLIDGINELFHIKFPGLNIAGAQIIPKIDFRLLNIPKIPLLAKGAVIPPNAPFMAMLGDQRRGTNIEAPLSTIQEAVRAELGSTEDAILAAAEALIERQERILEAIENIEVGDTTIGQAANRYNARLAITRGGA